MKVNIHSLTHHWSHMLPPGPPQWRYCAKVGTPCGNYAEEEESDASDVHQIGVCSMRRFAGNETGRPGARAETGCERKCFHGAVCVGYVSGMNRSDTGPVLAPLPGESTELLIQANVTWSSVTRRGPASDMSECVI